MPSVETMVSFMEQIANDDTHGYSQIHRTGPDYDCSSLVGRALEKGGFDSSVNETTRTLYNTLMRNGFYLVDVNGSRERGDVFLSVGHHVAVCVDANRLVHASIDENGTIIGATSGDQTGKEICIRSFYSHPWDYHFRYGKEESTPAPSTPNYTIGNEYTLQANMCVRTGAGTNFRMKAHSELTADGKAHDTDKNGCLEKGTRVTCKNIIRNGSDIWMQIPSGYVAAYYNGVKYVSDEAVKEPSNTEEGNKPVADIPSKSEHNYVIGNTYTLQANMIVRTGAGTNFRAKSHNELTEDGKAHDTDKNGCLEKGTRVTCKNIIRNGSDIWMQIPSGYIAAYCNGVEYIK